MKLHTTYFALALLLIPFVSFAQTETIPSILTRFVGFLNNPVIPFLLGLAFVVFVINVIRYFVFGSGNDDSREKARYQALYTVFAFVMITIFWGVVNILSASLNLSGDSQPVPDYIEESKK